jgi:carboxyl-terminal processing protease
MVSGRQPRASAARLASRGVPRRWGSLCPRLSVILIAALGLLSGCAMVPSPRALWNLAAPGAPEGGDRRAYNASVYDNAWSWVYSKYYDTTFNGVDWKAARDRHRPAALAAKTDEELYAAINALLDELHDRHTHAATSEEFQSLFERVYAVIGIRTEPVEGATDGRRRIVDVFKGADAFAKGVRPGWVLLSCDGKPPGEVLGPGKLRDGQIIHCEFLDERGAPRLVVLQSHRMQVPPFRTVEEVEPGVLALRFDVFDMPTANWVKEQIEAHPRAHALIIDLRGNGGGHLFALGKILAHVFEHPVNMGSMVNRGRESRWHRHISQSGGAHFSGKLAVITSQYTASAAEVFAQLVKDDGRGIVVGERSSGATLTSVFWPLRGGGKLQISVYDYRSPKGRRIEGNGVEPDVMSPVPFTSRKYDPAYKAAVRALDASESAAEATSGSGMNERLR